MNKLERWRDVIGYEGLYQVSDLGRVRSLDRGGRKGRIRKISVKNHFGHLGLNLSKAGKGETVYVHRLVMAAWVGPCPDGCEVLHGAAGITDNFVGNLSYGTRSQNLLDRRRDGTCGKAVIRSDGVRFESMREAAKESGCGVSGVGNACNGHLKTSGGYGWELT